MTLAVNIYDFLLFVLVLSACLILIFVALRWLMQTVSFVVNITIVPVTQPLAKVSDPLNVTGQVGQPFTLDLLGNVTGGMAPLSASINGTLPSGLSANGSVISGTPDTPGTTTLSVSVSDSSQ